jgi:CheY-like chemotaxis protein
MSAMPQTGQLSTCDAQGTTLGLRILVIDDNQDSADSLAMMLELLGHEVRSATDGLTGLETAQVFRPEVMFLDILMPRLSGYDLARSIREQQWGKQVSLVALSGWGQDDDQRRVQEAGFNHHLVKPVDFNAMLALLSDVAQNRS